MTSIPEAVRWFENSGLGAHLSPDNMGDLHKMIINNISEVVSRKTITLDQYWILIARRDQRLGTFGLSIPYETIHQISKLGVLLRHLQSYDMLLPLRSTIFCFLDGHMSTCPVII